MSSCGEVGGSIGREEAGGDAIQTTIAKLEIDPEDVNDIIESLDGIAFSKYIVLEDFHYLPVGVQKAFAIALKAFHESSSLCFIVVGVWLEENRLIQFNGDLTGRVIAINVDQWLPEQLRQVIVEGGKRLNVAFDEVFVENLIEGAYESVSIVQESCYRACIGEDIYGTQSVLKMVGSGVDARNIVKEVVEAQSGRYMHFVTNFASGFQQTELEMYKWVLYPVLTSEPDDLEEGLRLTEITKTIQSKHPRSDDLNPGNVTQALQSAASLQVKLGTLPIILDYDQTNRRLNVVDRGFLIWLSYQRRKELLDAANLPAA